MITFFRLHWFDIGLILTICVAVSMWLTDISLTSVQGILCLSLISLFLHQAEEYRFPGYFPGMLNRVLYHSTTPDRYPLNTQSALLVNVAMGWTAYLLAAVYAEHTLWLGIATVLVSLGNVVGHVLLFNIKGKTLYNPGMATAIFLFIPLVVWFFWTITTQHLAHPLDYALGIPLGILLNLSIVIIIRLWADQKTHWIFPQGCVGK